jgi:hypothetical protein
MTIPFMDLLSRRPDLQRLGEGPIRPQPQRQGVLQRLFGLPGGASPNDALMGGAMAAQQMDPGGRRGLIPALTRFMGGARNVGQQSAARQAQQQLLAGGATPETVMGLLAGGDPESARVVSGLLPGAGATPQHTFVNEGEGGRTGVLNARTGAIEWQRPAAPTASDSRMPMAVQRMAVESYRSFRTRVSVQNLESATTQAENLRDLIRQAREPGERGAQAIALITSFGKLVDPGSTVRESEFANIRNSGSLMTRVNNYLSQIGRGAPAARFLTSMEEAVNQLDTNYRQAYRHSADRENAGFRAITGYDLPLGEVPFYGPPAAAAPTPPPARAPGTGRDLLR